MCDAGCEIDGKCLAWLGLAFLVSSRSRLVSYCLVSSRRVLSRHFVSRHFLGVSCCVALSCLVRCCNILSCAIQPCLLVPYPVLPCPAFSYLILSCLALSFLFLSCLVVSCLTFLSWLVTAGAGYLHRETPSTWGYPVHAVRRLGRSPGHARHHAGSSRYTSWS